MNATWIKSKLYEPIANLSKDYKEVKKAADKDCFVRLKLGTRPTLDVIATEDDGRDSTAAFRFSIVNKKIVVEQIGPVAGDRVKDDLAIDAFLADNSNKFAESQLSGDDALSKLLDLAKSEAEQGQNKKPVTIFLKTFLDKASESDLRKQAALILNSESPDLIEHFNSILAKKTQASIVVPASDKSDEFRDQKRSLLPSVENLRAFDAIARTLSASGDRSKMLGDLLEQEVVSRDHLKGALEGLLVPFDFDSEPDLRKLADNVVKASPLTLSQSLANKRKELATSAIKSSRDELTKYDSDSKPGIQSVHLRRTLRESIATMLPGFNLQNLNAYFSDDDNASGAKTILDDTEIDRIVSSHIVSQPGATGIATVTKPADNDAKDLDDIWGKIESELKSKGKTLPEILSRKIFPGNQSALSLFNSSKNKGEIAIAYYIVRDVLNDQSISIDGIIRDTVLKRDPSLNPATLSEPMIDKIGQELVSQKIIPALDPRSPASSRSQASATLDEASISKVLSAVSLNAAKVKESIAAYPKLSQPFVLFSDVRKSRKLNPGSDSTLSPNIWFMLQTLDLRYGYGIEQKIKESLKSSGFEDSNANILRVADAFFYSLIK